jgi:hypothetical protein
MPGSFAGPPLAIDDPGVLNPGQWEIIGAVTGAGTASTDVFEVPLADVSYGLTPKTQLGVTLPFAHANVDGEEADRSFSNVTLAFKWQFASREAFQVSFAPGYAFGLSAAAARRGVGNDSGILFLPVNFEYAVGEWTVNGEFGYASVKDDVDALAYGAAFGHPIAQRTQVMFEIYGGSETDFAGNTMNFHVGFDIELNPKLHWLMSAGSGLWAPQGAEDLDYDFFLGIQYFTAGR